MLPDAQDAVCGDVETVGLMLGLSILDSGNGFAVVHAQRYDRLSDSYPSRWDLQHQNVTLMAKFSFFPDGLNLPCPIWKPVATFILRN